jgi:hypothetical protein
VKAVIREKDSREKGEVSQFYQPIIFDSQWIVKMLSEKTKRKLEGIEKCSERGKQSDWQKHMIARNRKTLVLCVPCHDLLHAGKLPDKRYFQDKMESRVLSK